MGSAAEGRAERASLFRLRGHVVLANEALLEALGERSRIRSADAFWRRSFQTSNETAMEKSFLVWRMAEELVNARIPTSPQLADQLAALYAQVRQVLNKD